MGLVVVQNPQDNCQDTCTPREGCVNKEIEDGSMRWRRWLHGLFLGILALAVNPKTGRAQLSAAIIGNVQDTTGAVVNGATITVKNQETGATRVATTDDTGNF